MLLGVRFAADTAILLIALALQVVPANRLFTGVNSRRSLYLLVLIFSSLLLYLGLAGNLAAIYGISGPTLFWARGLALAWALAVICSSLIAAGVKPLASATPADPGRRGFLQLAAKGAVAAPLAGVGFGMFIERDHFEVKEVSVPIAGLPKDLDGIRIAQLTDIHLGPFLSEKRFARAIDMANELKPHLAVATGDLISYRGDPLDDAIRQILRLKADAGIVGCHGNHEYYAGALEYATQEFARNGARILRMTNHRFAFGSAFLNIGGVDYQPMGSVYLQGAEELVEPGDVNILLSHNPDVFPVAAEKCFALTLSGHTHGGQINFEILHHNANMARFLTPYTKGLYQENGSAIYVSSGIGTIGVPVRFGAPPEVSLIKLCAI